MHPSLFRTAQVVLGKEGLRMQSTQRMLSQTGSVFWITAALSAALIVWGVFFTSSFAAAAQAAFDFTTANLSWFYMISTTLFLAFVIWLAFSRYGKIRPEPQ